MSPSPDLHLIEPDLRLVEEEAPASPTVFVRTLATPPGMPWDQARVATLEARVGAPLPLNDVVYRLRRLEPWRYGRPARYAACYVRAKDAGESFDTKVDVDGRSIPIRFMSIAERNRRARRLGLIALLVAAPTVLIGAAISSALAVREDTLEHLSMVEQRAAVKLKAAQTQARLYEDAKLLDAAGARQRSIGVFLNDLAWASGAKSADAHLDALHWEHGYLGVEVRGDTRPFGPGDRAVIKADKTIRPGVWLWGVGPPGSASTTQAPAPTSATPTSAP